MAFDGEEGALDDESSATAAYNAMWGLGIEVDVAAGGELTADYGEESTAYEDLGDDEEDGWDYDAAYVPGASGSGRGASGSGRGASGSGRGSKRARWRESCGSGSSSSPEQRQVRTMEIDTEDMHAPRQQPVRRILESDEEVTDEELRPGEHEPMQWLLSEKEAKAKAARERRARREAEAAQKRMVAEIVQENARRCMDRVRRYRELQRSRAKADRAIALRPSGSASFQAAEAGGGAGNGESGAGGTGEGGERGGSASGAGGGEGEGRGGEGEGRGGEGEGRGGAGESRRRAS